MIFLFRIIIKIITSQLLEVFSKYRFLKISYKWSDTKRKCWTHNPSIFFMIFTSCIMGVIEVTFCSKMTLPHYVVFVFFFSALKAVLCWYWVEMNIEIQLDLNTIHVHIESLISEIFHWRYNRNLMRLMGGKITTRAKTIGTTQFSQKNNRQFPSKRQKTRIVNNFWSR